MAVAALTTQLNGLSLESRYKLLAADITRAENQTELVRLWNEQTAYFNTINTSAFLHHLQRLPQTRKHGLTPEVRVVLNQLLLHAEELSDSFDNDSLRMLSNSLRHLKPENRRLFQKIKARLFDTERALLEKQEAKSLALFVDAAVELEEDPGLFLIGCKEVLLDPKLYRLKECKSEELACVAKAYCSQEKPHIDLFEAMQRHIFDNKLIPTFSPWHLAMLAGAVSNYPTHFQPLLSAICEHCKQHPEESIQKVDSVDLGHFKTACFSLYRHPRNLLSLIRDELHTKRFVQPKEAPASILLRMGDNFTGLAPTPTSLLEAIRKKLYTNDARALHALKPTDLVTGLRAFANAAISDPKLIAHFVHELSKQANLESLSAKELVRLAWVFTKLHPSPTPFVTLVTNELLKKLASLPLCELSKLAIIASQSNPVLMPILQATKRQLSQPTTLEKECGLVELAELACLYKRPGLYRSPEVFGFIEAKLAQIPSQSYIQYDPKYFVMLIGALLEVNPDRFSFENLALLAYRLVRIEQFDTELFSRIRSNLTQKMPQNGDANISSLMRASWSFIKIGKPHVKLTELFCSTLERASFEGSISYRQSEHDPVVELCPLYFNSEEHQLLLDIYTAMPPEMAARFPKLKELLFPD